MDLCVFGDLGLIRRDTMSNGLSNRAPSREDVEVARRTRYEMVM